MSILATTATSAPNKSYIPQATKVGDRFVVDDPIPMELAGVKFVKRSSNEYKALMSRLDEHKGFLNNVLTPEQVLQHQLGKAEQHNTQAYIKMNGQIVGILHTDGSATQRNHLRMEGNDNAERMRFLKQHYGSKVSIERFEAGKGPTYAEAFEAFNGKDYRQEIYHQYQMAARDRFETLQAQMRAQKAQQAWENEPQTQALSLEGLTISGWDQEGHISINHNNLKQLAEGSGYDLAYTRDIYRQLRDSQSPEQALSALQQHFSAEPELMALAEGQTLTRREVLHYTPEQIKDSYL